MEKLVKTAFGAIQPATVTHLENKADGAVVVHFIGGGTKLVVAADAPAIRELLVEKDEPEEDAG